MHVSRIVAAAAAAALACSLVILRVPRVNVWAQAPGVGYMQVTASRVSDATGGLLASGTVSFAPVDNNGKPISFKVGGPGGQVISQAVTAPVTNGVYSILLADTALTSPIHVCYSVTILDNVTGYNLLGPGYTCVQPESTGDPVTGTHAWCTAGTGSAGGACYWDQYVPNLQAQIVTQAGPMGPPPNMAVQSTTTLAPGQAATVTMSGTTPSYQMQFGIPAGVPGGSLSYPGVITDGNNGLTVAGGQAVGSTTTPATLTYAADSAKATYGNMSNYMTVTCTNTVNAFFIGAGATTGQVGTHHFCLNLGGLAPKGTMWSAPGIDYGTPTFGPTGWSVQTGLQVQAVVNTPGIYGDEIATHVKSSIGDNVNAYFYNYFYGGAVSGSDEGNYNLGTGLIEQANTFTGTVATGSGGTGATGLKINCLKDCANPGDGRYLYDTVNPVTGFVTARTLPSGSFTPGTFTTDVAVTPSTFWCTAGPLGIPTPAPSNPALAGVQATPVTWVCNSGPGNTGAPAVGNLLCFGGNFHEQATVSGFTGTGPWNITASLRHAHEANSYVVAGGPCGQFIEFTADTVLVNAVGNGSPAQPIRYPIDILGAPDAHTLWWRMFSLVGASNSALTQGNVRFPAAFAGTTATNTAGVVTFNNITSSQTFGSNSYLFNQPTLTISGTGTAFDTQCTNSAPDSTGHLLCTQAASTGVGPVTGLTLSIGSSGKGNGGFNLYKGAEVLDVQTYTTSPPSVSPGNVTTLALEPNNAAWAPATTVPVYAGDAVEQAHHYLLQAHTIHEVEVAYNPMVFSTNVHSITAAGGGIRGGNTGNPAGNFSMENITNTSPLSQYTYRGGFSNPPGGIALGGLMNYGLYMQWAPGPPGSSAFYIGCPASTISSQGDCTDPSFNYNLFTMAGTGGSGVLNWVPSTHTFNWGPNQIPMDMLNLLMQRPTIQSAANGSTATLKFNAMDSGGTAHAITIAAPITGAGGFTLNLPALTASGTVALASQLNAMRAGAWSITGATSALVTFAPAFSATPTSCAITPTSDPTAVGALWYTALSFSGFTVNVHTSGTISGTYQCVIQATAPTRGGPHPKPPGRGDGHDGHEARQDARQAGREGRQDAREAAREGRQAARPPRTP